MSTPPFLFDLDGTLVDSRVVVARHWALFADRHGLALAPILAVCHGRRTVDTLVEIAPGLDAAHEATILDTGEETDVDGLVAVPGAAELLGRIDGTQWAVVTSGHRALATSRLEAVGLPVPRVLVTGDEVVRGKPHPEGFLRAAEQLGVPPSACVVVEDAPVGVAAGRAAGARVVAVTTTHPAEALRDADLVVPDLRGLDVAVRRVEESSRRR